MTAPVPAPMQVGQLVTTSPLDSQSFIWLIGER